MSRDQRKHERYAVSLPVVLIRGKQTANLMTADVSMTGLFVLTNDPPPLRELVKVDVAPGLGEKPVRFMGMAVHVVRPETSGGRPVGVGVQFFGMDAATRDQWAKVVAFAKSQARVSSDGMESRRSTSAPTTPAKTAPASVPNAGASAPAGTAAPASATTANATPANAPPSQPSAARNSISGRPSVDIRVIPRHVKDLEAAFERGSTKGSVMVSTELEPARGTVVRLVFSHPQRRDTFSLVGIVRGQISVPNFKGVQVDLRGFDAEQQQAFCAFAGIQKAIAPVATKPAER